MFRGEGGLDGKLSSAYIREDLKVESDRKFKLSGRKRGKTKGPSEKKKNAVTLFELKGVRSKARES